MVEENELQIERLLKLNPEFKLERQHSFIGHEGLRGLSTCQRLYPHLDECNGYFIASLRREY
jgi:16S rRNA C967 or C1407 C5-methylase (RsmB/RsmF family)